MLEGYNLGLTLIIYIYKVAIPKMRANLKLMEGRKLATGAATNSIKHRNEGNEHCFKLPFPRFGTAGDNFENEIKL